MQVLEIRCLAPKVLAMLTVLAALMLPLGSALKAETNKPNRSPHPVMTAFLEELKSGELDKAAKRIATVNDLFGRQRQYTYFTQAELVALLATCDLASHSSLKTAVSIERTVWDCPKGEQYSMIFNHVGSQTNPYLYVGRIETAQSREAKEARNAERIASGEFPPPPITLQMASTPEERAARQERKRLEELDEARKRDIVGQAVLTGKLDRIAEFVTSKTDSAYITYDPYFDVKIKHINGIEWADVQLVLRRAIEELGSPVSVECKLGEGRWAPHICEWELDNPENSMRAKMNFKGEGGTMNSIRVYRMTPEEAAELREQALRLGAIEG